MRSQYDTTIKALNEPSINHCKIIVEDCFIHDSEPLESVVTIKIEILDSPYQDLVYVENFTVIGYEAVALAERLYRDGYLKKYNE